MRVITFLFLIFCFFCVTARARGDFSLVAKMPLSAQVINQINRSFANQALLARVSRSLVQVSRPGAAEVLGTGFVLRAQNRLWVAMPYHVGGVAGSPRTIRFAGAGNLLVEREVTIAVNGNAGWHAPDVSLAEFPPEFETQVEPLEIGALKLNQQAYSFGYVAGRKAGLEEILPVERSLFMAEGFGVISDRKIFGEDPQKPFNISGYCGAPVVQWENGEWRAVALHAGSCVTSKGLKRSFAINLRRVVPLLLNRYLQNEYGYSRQLLFRGWRLATLLPSERVYSIEVWREGERVFQCLLRNFPSPYSDEHSELALEAFEALPKDELRYQIRNNQRETRFISYVLP